METTLLLIEYPQMIPHRKAVASEEEALARLEYWSEIIKTNGDPHIMGTSPEDYARFTPDELELLYTNITGQEATEADRKSIQARLTTVVSDNIPLDNTDLDWLKKKLGRPLAAPVHGAAKKSAPAPATSAPVAIKRPKPGTASALVWEEADKALPSAGVELDRAFRDMVIDNCVSAGIAKATAATQYAKWKKDHLANG